MKLPAVNATAAKIKMCMGNAASAAAASAAVGTWKGLPHGSLLPKGALCKPT
jgi:hypothetical protein